MPIEKYGGAERDRTVDPLLAKQVLSQLSYRPETAASSLQRQQSSLTADATRWFLSKGFEDTVERAKQLRRF